MANIFFHSKQPKHIDLTIGLKNINSNWYCSFVLFAKTASFGNIITIKLPKETLATMANTVNSKSRSNAVYIAEVYKTFLDQRPKYSTICGQYFDG